MLRTRFRSAASIGSETSSARCALAGTLVISGPESICARRVEFELRSFGEVHACRESCRRCRYALGNLAEEHNVKHGMTKPIYTAPHANPTAFLPP